MPEHNFRTPEAGGSLLLAVNLEGKNVLIVGGGQLAASRLFRCLEASAQVTLVSPFKDLNEELKYRVSQKDSVIDYIDSVFEPDYLEGKFMVMSAISDPVVSKDIVQRCRNQNILVNCLADNVNECDFWFTSTVRRGPIQVGVTSNSQAPKLAVRVRKQIEANLPDHLGGAAQKIGQLRKQVRELDPAKQSSKCRMGWLSQLCTFWSLEQLASLSIEQMSTLLQEYSKKKAQEKEFKREQEPAAPTSAHVKQSEPVSSMIPAETSSQTLEQKLKYEQEHSAQTTNQNIENKLETNNIYIPETCANDTEKKRAKNKKKSSVPNREVPLYEELFPNQSVTKKGTIHLVGAGPGDPDLVTLAAKKAIMDADVIYSDKLIPSEVYAGVSCPVITARKFPGNARRAQNELQDLALEAINSGKKVVRLKGGDPFMYGRGGEEIVFFRKHGIEPVIIPGVSSSIAAAGAAKIPVTHRGVANQLLIVTGWDRKGGFPNIPAYEPTRTIVVLMGLARLEKICEQLTSLGWPADSGIAVIERAWHPTQRVIRGTMTTISSLVRLAEVSSPATIVIGRVVSALDMEDRGECDGDNLSIEDVKSIASHNDLGKVDPLNKSKKFIMIGTPSSTSQSIPTITSASSDSIVDAV